jgi:hypothetical protein
VDADDDGKFDGVPLFNRLNVVGYKPRRRFGPAAAYDAVIVPWQDRDSRGLKREMVYPENSDALRPFRVPVIGIYNNIQAYTRAYFEWIRLRSRMDQLSLTTTAEGALVDPWSPIRVVRLDLPYYHDGEVIAYSDAKKRLTLSNDVEFGHGVHGDVDSSAEHTIVLRDRALEWVREVSVTEGIEKNEVIITAGATDVGPESDRLRGTLYAFGPRNDHLAETWIATDIEVLDEVRVKIECISTDGDEFNADYVPSPADAGRLIGGVYDLGTGPESA